MWITISRVSFNAFATKISAIIIELFAILGLAIILNAEAGGVIVLGEVASAASIIWSAALLRCSASGPTLPQPTPHLLIYPSTYLSTQLLTFHPFTSTPPFHHPSFLNSMHLIQ